MSSKANRHSGENFNYKDSANGKDSRRESNKEFKREISVNSKDPSKRESKESLKREINSNSKDVSRKESSSSKSSVVLRDKRKQVLKRAEASDSVSEDGSDDNQSVASNMTDGPPAAQQGKKLRHQKTMGEWEIIEGLKEGQTYQKKPRKFEGYLMKRRKWPMKGWHKRYFVLDSGIMTYAKTPSDIAKGKIHGTIDLGLSVISYKKYTKRLDIDAEDIIYHLKVKSSNIFDGWITEITHHRLYRQHKISYGDRDVSKINKFSSQEETAPETYVTPTQEKPPDELFRELQRTLSLTKVRSGSMKSRSSTLTRGQGRVAAWLLDMTGLDKCNTDLENVHARLVELNEVLQKLGQSNSPLQPGGSSNTELNTSSLKKEKTGIRLSFRKSSSKKEKKGARTPELPRKSLLSPGGSERFHLSSSNPNLSTLDTDRGRPISLPNTFLNTSPPSKEQLVQDNHLREDFIGTAKNIYESLKGLVSNMDTEREKIRHALEQDSLAPLGATTNYAVKQQLIEAQRQNAELRARLSRIAGECDVSGVVPIPTVTVDSAPVSPRPTMTHSISADSTSICEFFDANEYLMSSEASSDISDEEDDASSDISDTENTTPGESVAEVDDQGCPRYLTGRRTKLPSPRPDTGDVSLWGLLCRNIGKDLSKISMPVTLNEPLNMLQWLCEELEYSEMLDKAAEIQDPVQRMVHMAAFAVSGYASSYYRCGQKPFNPLLGETYECVREDKGWRFISEQVSHHPPISACYCESKNFVFSQDAQIKTKFWGKSMEIQPVGVVCVKLPKFNEQYQWNKVTTCVHNILGGQRWSEQYGEMNIKCDNGITCKLTFTKASYWSEKCHEVYGSICNADRKVLTHIFGKWNEGIYSGHAPSAKCIWRPGAMPEDYELYYGFTRFAIELNELCQEDAKLLPATDTRFRTDQRLLEEGNVQGAENEKLRLELMQREKRKRREEEGIKHEPRWFRRLTSDKSENYVYGGQYWNKRKDPGFARLTFPKLW
ncbi:unnamed protein product [Owenia fusiformis]|uniref:Oxysterol-binding protein n=1 Tax=Owenia fusiformis TaxID=6347 RepID=A0A8S4P0T8_OWEFU|nr:unnamed protein product [Owenia fusiformis]